MTSDNHVFIRFRGLYGNHLFRAALHAGLLLGLLTPTSQVAAGLRTQQQDADSATALLSTPATAPSTFAPVEADDPLAELWNDPEFTRRLLGSYGFRSSVEPPLNSKERELWRDAIVPLLRQGPTNAIPALRAAARPDASALFDFTLGTVYFQTGAFTNALPHYEAALAKFPDYQRAWKNLGMAHVRLGNYAAAVRPLGRALELGGADAGTLGLLGFALRQQGRPVAAAAALQQALMFKPDDFNLQLQLLQAWVAAAEYEPALHLLDELLPAHPDRPSLWTLKANIHIQRNEIQMAAVAYEMLRRLGGASPENLYLLGDLHLTLGARDLALAAYRSAIQEGGAHDPDRALRAAEVLAEQGQWDEAEALAQTLRDTNGGVLSGPTELKWLKLKARIALGRGKTDAALATLEKVSERDPLDGEALLLAGDCLARKGEREKAEFRYDTAAKIERFAPDALVRHAQLLVRHHAYRRAAELLQKAQQLKPRDHVKHYLEAVLKLATSQ